MMSQTGQQITTIHILLNISKSKSYQPMQFGQLIEYKMKNIFLKKSCTKRGGKASPTLFNKNQNSPSP